MIGREKGMKKLLLIALLSLACAAPLRAAFEDVETGPRASAMAGAYSAAGEDSGAIFYNPAGITGLSRYDVSLSQEKLFLGLTDGSSIMRSALSLGTPLMIGGSYWGALAFGMDTLSLDSLYSESRMRLGYGYPVKDNVWAGLSIARMSLTYGSDQYTRLNPVLASATGKSGMGLDLGVVMKLESADLGLAILNANEPDMGIMYPNKVSRKIDLGLALKREALTWAFDLVISGKDLKIKTGTEVPVLKETLGGHALVRGGIALGSRDYRAASAGFGYRGASYGIDYAFIYPLSGIADTMGHHQIGAHFAWGKPRGPMADREEEKKAKSKAGQGGGQGRGAGEGTGPRTEVTPSERARAYKILRDARTAMRKGSYAEALETLKKADELLISDSEVKESMSKMTTVRTILPEATSLEERDDLVRKAINRYADKNTDAVLYITYARQRWPKDVAVARLYSVVSKEFPETASNLRILPGITIIDQLLQDALDAIRNGRFIQAISTLQRVLQLEPDNIPALTRMGSAYWAMEKKDIARQNWKKVLQLDPGNREVIQFLRQN